MDKVFKIGNREFVLDQDKAEAAYQAKRVINGYKSMAFNLLPLKYQWAYDLYRTMKANHWEPEDIQMQKDMVAAGIGYALLSMTSVLDELKTNRLSATRIVNPEIVRPIYIGLPARKPSLATREVARLVREVASSLAASGVWGDEARAA